MGKNFYELTNPQKTIWLTEQYYSGTSINNLCGYIWLKMPVDVQILQKSAQKLIESNDNFRLRFTTDKNNVPQQYVSDFQPIEMEHLDLNSEKELNAAEEVISARPFNLIDSQLVTFTSFKLANGTGGLILNLHHLVADAWSFSLIITQFIEIYKSFLNNTPFEYTYHSYLDYISSEKKYLESDKFINDEAYWNSIFNVAPNIATFPSPKGMNISTNSTNSKRKTFSIHKKLISKIQAFYAKEKITIFNFFMAVIALHTGRVSGLDEFVIGTPILNRTNFKEKNTLGMFISTAPFKIKLNHELSFLEFVTQISKDTKSLLRHQKYPYQKTLQNIRKADPSVPNLYKILLSYQNARAQKTCDEFPYEVRWATNSHLSDDINIHIYDLEDSGEFSVSYDYLKSKYTSEEISNIHTRILGIINQVLDNPLIELSKINIVSDSEKKLLLYRFNNTYLPYDKNKTIIDLFEEQVLRTPNKIALIFEDSRLTYNELNQKANQLAHTLISLGVKPGNVVAVLLNRSLEMIIALIAILKTGAAYLPLDPDYPIDRIKYMLKNSDTNLVLVHDKTENILNDSFKKLNINLKNNIYETNSIDNPNISFSSDSLMYLIYTSGSTGLPKGVLLTHKNVHNFINGTTSLINFSPDKTIVSLTTICFDIFVLETWIPFSKGLTVVLASEEECTNSLSFNKLCQKYTVNMMQTTPSRFNAFFENKHNQEYLKNITDIMCGGEPLSKDLLWKFKKKTHANIYNMYGPTETTVWSTIKDLTSKNEITIGKPIANTSCYILDKNRNLLPPYAPGELHIGGDGVSKGYLKRDDLNNEKFTISPFKENEIIYNTNDLAMFDKNGEIIHLGRTDFQVKIRGFRVELGEIEDVIARHPLIKRNVVVCKDNKFLVCYYLADGPVESSNLIEYISKSLPPYMIPSKFERLTAFPFTPNGKLDRKKLLSNIDTIKNNIETASTELEKQITVAIQKVLNTNDALDVNAPFFSLGLDSLSLVQLQTALVYLGTNLSTQDFYKYPTIKQLAKKIDCSLSIDDTDDFCIDEKLLHSKFALKEKTENVLGNVFITGANGFIGIHIVNELLNTTDSKIYCLVRGSTLRYATQRFVETYKFYFNKDISHLLNLRLFILNGDLLNPNFGLEEKSIENLILNTNTIIHAAANVKHYGLYEKFKNINIDGTHSICKFAYINKKRFIHISSISVSGNYLVKQDNKNVEFSENNLYIGQHYTENVYVNSKYEAEKIVLNYLANGLVGKILRIGIVSGRFTDGIFQKNISENAFYNRIKSIISLGTISEKMLSQHIEFTPVDFCAKAIVLLATNSLGDNKIYHLYNHNLSSIKEIIAIAKELGMDLKIVDNQKFKDFILNISQNSPLSSSLSGIVNDFNFNMSSSLEINYDFTVDIKSNFTTNILSKLNFEWPEISDEYIRKILFYMKEVKFI